MLQGWVVVIIALAYIGFLFLVASYGDRRRELSRGTTSRLLIYPLSLAIYCTSWTFFGSVGLASRGGLDFFAIYIGPMVMVGLAYPLLIRIVRLAKGQNITSIADLIAARYGKSQAVAATVALIAIVGMVPYIALQLKAVSSSVGTILAQAYPGGAQPIVGDSALFVALLMAAFAVLFGTRHTDATEHQDGLMLAIATESIVKLVAFLAVGIFVTFVMFHGPLALFTRALDQANTAAVLTRVPPLTSFFAMTVLSLFAIVLLPRQFHVAVVENHSEAEIRRAAWLFPAYLVLINLFVLPIAMAGLLTFPAGQVDSDMFVLALPIAAHSESDHAHRLRRRAVGGDRHGDRGIGGAGHHGVERHRGAAGAQAPGRARRRPERRRRLALDHAAHRHLRHPAARLHLLSLGRRRAACRHRAIVVRGHRATGAGVFRRADLAARHRARCHRRHDRGHSGLGLYAARCRAFPMPASSAPAF